MRKFVFCLLLSPLVASAAEWKYLNYFNGGDSGSLEAYFIDPSAIDTSKNIRKAWLYSIKKHVKTGVKTSIKTQIEFNCKAKTNAILNQFAYTDTGELSSSFTPKEKSWEDIIPDTLGEDWLGFVCGSRQKIEKAETVNPNDVSDTVFSLLEKPQKEDPPQ